MQEKENYKMRKKPLYLRMKHFFLFKYDRDPHHEVLVIMSWIPNNNRADEDAEKCGV
jgi:hypothetical protein